MSEEEKKAIEDLNEINYLLDDVYSTGLVDDIQRNEYEKTIYTILNLIEKQQKEIEHKDIRIDTLVDRTIKYDITLEKFQKENGKLRKEIEKLRIELYDLKSIEENHRIENGKLQYDYISKEKIKEKIKQYDDLYKENIFDLLVRERSYCLKELLEEE